MIVRGGHRKIFKFAKIHYTKWHKTWLTLFTYYSINQEQCPPLATTSLGQAVPSTIFFQKTIFGQKKSSKKFILLFTVLDCHFSTLQNMKTYFDIGIYIHK